MTDFIPLCVPSVGAEELLLLQQCVEDNFVSSVGPFVTQFEDEFAEYVGADHAIATSSGTTALHLGMLLHGLGPGDLVAVSDFTFIASANAAAYTGAQILLVDSEADSWGLDGELLYDHVKQCAAAGKSIPTAVEIVHILGQPARLEPFFALQDEFGTILIEDAAEALGATYCNGELGGRHVGTIGSVGGYSFNGNKIMTTGSGGMLVTSDSEFAVRAKHLSTQAKLAGPEYLHDEIGYNYRMSNITAAVGLAQLRKLPRFLEHKRRIAEQYNELLDPELFEQPPATSFARPTYWLYTVQVEEAMRDGLIAGLGDAGIQARSVWPPLRRQAPYRQCPTVGAGVGDRIWKTAVSLPSSVDLTENDIGRVASVANAIARRLSKEKVTS